MNHVIRKEMHKLREAITQEEVSGKSKLILENLLSLERFKKAYTMMVYVSKKGEVDTHELIRKCLAGKAVVVPKIDRKKNEIIPCKINSLEELELGSFSVLEPKFSEEIRREKIDLFVVPGLAFDLSGNRVGYGHGYWDRFLKGIDKKRIVGLCFENHIKEKIEVQPHDISVSKIVTEKRIISC